MATENVSVTLTAYNMGPDAIEADFDAFARFVNERIDDKCGFPVDVDQFRFANSGEAEDRVSGATDEQAETVREAMRVLWEEWCASGYVSDESSATYTISNIAGGDERTFRATSDGQPSDASIRHARRQGSMGYRCSDAEIATQIDHAIEDVAFEDARDVTSILYRLHPIDVGFDLRSEDVAVDLDDEPVLRVSYPDEDGARRVIDGPRADVVARLIELGFRVTTKGGTDPFESTAAPLDTPSGYEITDDEAAEVLRHIK